MERHDPLSELAPTCEAAPEPMDQRAAHKERPSRKRARRRKSGLLQVVLAVPDNTLAFLYYRGEVPADPAIEQIRRDFTAFCEANLFYSDWRQAWGGFV